MFLIVVRLRKYIFCSSRDTRSVADKRPAEAAPLAQQRETQRDNKRQRSRFDSSHTQCNVLSLASHA